MPMTISKFAFKQRDILDADLYYHGHPGVCAELTRRWIKTRATGSRSDADDVVSNFRRRTDLRGIVAGQDAAGRWVDKKIGGMKASLAATRTGHGGCVGFDGLRSRDDVITYVVSVPGLYLYQASADRAAGGSHAFSFDSRGVNGSRTVLFFDPNQGEWTFGNVTLNEIRDWWRAFWQGTDRNNATGIDYKSEFSKGLRELVRYTVPGQA